MQRSPIRNCVIAIELEYAEKVQRCQRVLEIGCGTRSYLSDRLKKKVIPWVGLDIQKYYMGKRTITTVIARAGALPFKTDTFDVVVATQAFDHWVEWGDSHYIVLSEIHRVLKNGGQFWVNVPIYYHGYYLFEQGRIRGIVGRLERFF